MGSHEFDLFFVHFARDLYLVPFVLGKMSLHCCHYLIKEFVGYLFGC
jgi:hypothetical protein